MEKMFVIAAMICGALLTGCGGVVEAQTGHEHLGSSCVGAGCMPTAEATQSLAAGSCKLCANPSLSGQCITVQEGVVQDLSLVGFKDTISSVQLSAGQSLQYWTWNKESIHDRGIIYRVPGGSYESTDGRNLNPEYWLDTNDNFDFVRCDNFSRWEAILYADPNRSGGRFYLSPSSAAQFLEPINMQNKISSVYLRAGTSFNFSYYTAFGTPQTGWIRKNYSNQYSSSAGGGDNTPESWLKTNDVFSQVVVDKNMPVFIQRHGATDDGTNITPAGQVALQNAWNAVDCHLINTQPSIYYLSNPNDLSGSQRYVLTSGIIKQALESHCHGTSVSLVPLVVQDLSSFNAAQAAEVMAKIQEQNDSTTRIFVLGSFLLHKLTEGTDCGSASCYLKQWPAFMTLWNASRSLQNCQVGVDPHDRQFMYNHVYRVQRFVAGGTTDPVCMSSFRVPLDAYTRQSCGTAQANLDAANTCPL